MCSGSEAGSYFRLIDFVYHSTLGLRVIKKRREWGGGPIRGEGAEAEELVEVRARVFHRSYGRQYRRDYGRQDRRDIGGFRRMRQRIFGRSETGNPAARIIYIYIYIYIYVYVYIYIYINKYV